MFSLSLTFPIIIFPFLYFIYTNSSTGISYDFSCTIEPVNEYIAKTYIFTPPVSSVKVKKNSSTTSNANNTKSGESNPIKDKIKSLSDNRLDATLKVVTLKDPNKLGLTTRGSKEYALNRINELQTKSSKFKKISETGKGDLKWYNNIINNICAEARIKYGYTMMYSKPKTPIITKGFIPIVQKG